MRECVHVRARARPPTSRVRACACVQARARVRARADLLDGGRELRRSSADGLVALAAAVAANVGPLKLTHTLTHTLAGKLTRTRTRTHALSCLHASACSLAHTPAETQGSH
eukprot:1087745-Pleurochrysis_carterae.AAC.1